MLRWPRFLALALLASVLAPSLSHAVTITLRTGVDASLTPLGQNVADPFWTISVKGGAFVAAEVANTEVICCGMATVTPEARWISDPSITAGSGNTGWGVRQTAVVRRSFDLTGLDLATVSLSGLWRVADAREGVYLNGNLLPGTGGGAAGYQSDQTIQVLAASGFFAQGVNVLEFRGTSSNSQFDAFWFSGTVTGSPIGVAEPTTLMLLGVGLASARAARRLRS
jgi:hypothetical protein